MSIFKKLRDLNPLALILLLPTTLSLSLWIQSSAAGVTDSGEFHYRGFNSTPLQKDLLPESVSLYVTKRGQLLFQNDIVKTLMDNGIGVDQGDIDSWIYTSPTALRLDSLPVHMQKFNGTLKDLRDEIKKWLIGFQLNDPKITIDVKGIQYQAVIKRLGLRTNLKQTQSIHQDNLVVVDLEVEVPAIKVQIENARVSDSANTFLGKSGINHFESVMAKSSDPKKSLKFRVPLSIELNANHHIKVQALQVQSSLALLDIDWKFQHPLVLPKVDVSINGKKMTLSYAELEKYLATNERALAKAAQAYIADYFAEQGPALINDSIEHSHINHIFQEVNSLSPPGAPTTLKDPPPYLWGVIPDHLQLDEKFLSFGITAFIEDPTSKIDIPNLKVGRATGPVDMSIIDPSTYDVALGLDQAFVNRMLQLSFLRGYFNEVAVSGADPIKLAEVPLLEVDKYKRADHATLHLVAEQDLKPTDLLDKIEQGIAIVNPIQVEFDLNLILKVNPSSNSVEMVMDQIDLDSVSIDPKYIRFKLFTNAVLNQVKARLALVNAGMKAKPTNVNDPLVIPKNILGIPIKLHDLKTDTNGHFILFLNYGA